MNSPDCISDLKSQAPLILPSLLLCDFGNLEREIDRLHQAGVQALHLDVMDGVFVPNFTYGLPIVEAIRRLTHLPVDVHLMIADPGKYARAFVDAGADMVTFHVEAVEDPMPILETIRQAGASPGIAINPQTKIESVASCLRSCDLVCVMSVEAGFGGQSFQPSVLEKFSQIREIAGEGIALEIDGGVNEATAETCVAHGAELLVAGSAIFGHSDYRVAVENLGKHLQTN